MCNNPHFNGGLSQPSRDRQKHQSFSLDLENPGPSNAEQMFQASSTAESHQKSQSKGEDQRWGSLGWSVHGWLRGAQDGATQHGVGLKHNSTLTFQSSHSREEGLSAKGRCQGWGSGAAPFILAGWFQRGWFSWGKGVRVSLGWEGCSRAALLPWDCFCWQVSSQKTLRAEVR